MTKEEAIRNLKKVGIEKGDQVFFTRNIVGDIMSSTSVPEITYCHHYNYWEILVNNEDMDVYKDILKLDKLNVVQGDF